MGVKRHIFCHFRAFRTGQQRRFRLNADKLPGAGNSTLD